MNSRFIPLIVGVCVIGFGSHLAAQTTVTTDPVGFQSTTVPVGMTTLGNPLVNSDVVRSAASANTISNITFSGVTNFATLLTAGEPYYVEVVSGSLNGERYEVNTAATIAAANAVVTITTNSPNNTSTLLAGSLTNNTTLALRKHVTIEQVAGYFSPSLIGNNTANSADQISLFNSSSRSFVNYFLRGDGVTWRQVGQTTSANKVPIPPGVGFLVTKRSSATTYTSVGSVRNNNFAFPLPAGLTLRAPGYPVSYTPAGSNPASLGAVSSNKWTGNNTANNADQLQVFNPASRTWTSYFLRGDGVTWRQVGQTVNVSSQELFAANNAFMVSKRTNDSYILVRPFSQ